MSRLAAYAGALALGLVLHPLPAAADLPVKVYKEGRSFRGSSETVIPVPGEPENRYLLHSAYKVGGRPWADMIAVRTNAGGFTYLSRTYDCARGTVRWLGEGRELGKLSLAVTSVAQTAPRALRPGTTEYALAAYVCGL